jgi:hypothetical protein
MDEQVEVRFTFSKRHFSAKAVFGFLLFGYNNFYSEFY